LLKSQGMRGDVKVDEGSAWLARAHPHQHLSAIPCHYVPPSPSPLFHSTIPSPLCSIPPSPSPPPLPPPLPPSFPPSAPRVTGSEGDVKVTSERSAWLAGVRTSYFPPQVTGLEGRREGGRAAGLAGENEYLLLTHLVSPSLCTPLPSPHPPSPQSRPALLKSQGLRGDVKVDERSAWLARVRPLSASLSVPLVYPRLFALHHLLKTQRIMRPLSASLCVPLVYPRLFALHHLLKDAANQRSAPLSASLCVPLVPSPSRSAPPLKDAANHDAANQSFESTQNSTYHTLPSALPLSSEKLESDGVYLEENGEEAVEQQKQQNGTEEGQEQHEHLPSARPFPEQQNQQNGTEEEQQHEHLPSALPLSSEKLEPDGLEPDGVFLVENGEEAVVWVGREADSHLLFDLFGLRSVDEIAPGRHLLFDLFGLQSVDEIAPGPVSGVAPLDPLDLVSPVSPLFPAPSRHPSILPIPQFLLQEFDNLHRASSTPL
ncbi:unnamed protein product, partial [Closterium sp. NIES-64]